MNTDNLTTQATIPQSTAPRSNILVAGDAGPDFNIYLHSDADNPPPGTHTAIRKCLGGAGLVQQILSEWCGTDPDATACHQLRPLELAPPTFGVWLPHSLGKDFAEKGDKNKVWRIRRSIRSGPCDAESPLPTTDDSAPLPDGYVPGVLVMIDHADCYRHPHGETLPHEPYWKRPDVQMVWKMAPPFCRGELWWRAVEAGAPARSIVVLTLRHLRTEAVRVSCRISWERTALEIARELEHNPALADLRSCRDVVVTIHGEGAVWRSWKADSPDEADYHLIFDPASMEGEWSQTHELQGDAYGYASTMTSSLAAQLAMNGGDRGTAIDTGIRNGLHAMRLLHVLGHGPADEKSPPPAFPLKPIALALRGAPAAFSGLKRESFGDFGLVEIPAAEIANCSSFWRIAACGSQGIPLHGLARRYALFGERELGNIPHARFGALLTADRSEIEALRNFKTLIHAYQAAKETKPLSLAVFGPPGAGKSFGVKQIAKQVLGKDCTTLEFNLSQFDEVDLAGAFHQVRDAVLRGSMPVVFWDEFDSSEYIWLKRLLAPMNDGVFQEGQITHPLGRCIFVFAGGTSNDFQHFGPADTATAEDQRKWKLLKGPDFKSRLHGTLDILGPNQRQIIYPDQPASDDPLDVGFPLRRAILLRSALKLKPGERLEMDPGLLSALLETPRYTNGSRSFEKICLALRDSVGSRKRYIPSDLPNDAAIAMNVDDIRNDDGTLKLTGVETFKSILNREDNFREKARSLAKAIHDVWRTGKRARVGLNEKFSYDCEFEELPIHKKNENIAAAKRMPRNLALAGMLLVPAADAKGLRVESLPENVIRFLAEEEHAGWLEVALAEGYRQKKDSEDRDDSRYIHDCIVPWEKLPDGQRGYDKDIVLKYPIYAKMADFAIVHKDDPNS